MNMFRRHVYDLYPPFTFGERDFAHAHNLWLQVAVDLGLPAMIAYIVIWIVAFKLLWQMWRIAPTIF